MGNNNLMVSGTPHIRSNETITSIMRDVVIALCPAAIMGIIFFGISAAIEIAMHHVSFLNIFITKLLRSQTLFTICQQ